MYVLSRFLLKGLRHRFIWKSWSAMNLFSLTANHSAAKAATSDPLGAGPSPARADTGMVSQQDFSKYFAQIMKAGVPQRHPDALRQDLAAHHALSQTGQDTDARETQTPSEIQRDARFAAARANTADAPQRSSAKSAAKATQARKTTDGSEISESDRATAQLPPVGTENAMSGQDADPTLKTVALSPQVHIITAEQGATSEESLADYARHMGMDESTIQKLLNPNASTLGVPTVSTPLGTDANPLSNLPQAPSPLGTVLTGNGPLTGTSLPAIGLLASTPLSQALQGLANGEASAKESSLTAVSTSPDDLSSFAALKAGGWKGLDNVMLQMTSLPTASTPATQPVSTLAILSMMDSQLSSEAIDALAQSFEEAPAIEAPEPAGSGLSALDPGRTTLAQGKTSATTATTNLPANMAETYEKLSAKLSTELAARMHQQINDGEWKMKFALKPASLGAVDIQLEMRDGKLAALFQADNPLTQDLLQHGSQRLKHALSEMGLTQTSIQFGQGQGQHSGQTAGQSSTQSGTSQFGDNHGQAKSEHSDEVASESARRNSLSQFDLYA